jgi:Lrp/AsnC family leucine-responsive transcriptional regulator
VEITTLDDIDFRIISALVQDGRMAFAQLGAAVGLSPHGAADRVRRLRQAGVITGFTATVAMENVGRSLDAFIDVRLPSATAPEAFERFVRSLPAVREVAFVTGRFDYHVRVACRNVDDLDQTVRQIKRDGGAVQTETRIVLRATPGTPQLT